MKKIKYVVHSIRFYKKDGDRPEETYVRIDQLLYDGPAFAEMDSTVYDMDDFSDIHEIYLRISTFMVPKIDAPFEYDYSVWTRYKENLKREIARMV